MQKLIFIDDDPFYHSIIKRILAPYNNVFEVTHCEDASIILEYLQENFDNSSQLPDAIFIDLSMPKMNGWTFLEMFHSIASKLRKTIRLYVVSSSIGTNDIRRFTSYPFVADYIIKPLNRKTLEKLLNL